MIENNATHSALDSEFPLRPIEVISVLAAAGLVLAHLIRFALTPELHWWLTLVAIAAGMLAADFVSGVIHWAGDTWGGEGTLWIGPRFIRPFRFHHAQALDMLGSHFFTTNGDTALASLPFLLAPFAVPLDAQAGQSASVFLWTVGAWGHVDASIPQVGAYEVASANGGLASASRLDSRSGTPPPAPPVAVRD